jgi:16S rRNA processing protein RimM
MQVVVGRIGRAHGLGGDVSVEVRTDEPERRLGIGAVLLTDPASVGPLTIANGRVHSGRLLLRFAEIESRTAAETLRGTLLLVEVDPSELPEDDDEWYDFQLTGLAAVRPDGTPLGTVTEVVHLPAQDLLAVRTADEREVLVPLVHEIVPDVDVPAGRVVIDPPLGLFEDLDEQPDEHAVDTEG